MFTNRKLEILCINLINRELKLIAFLNERMYAILRFQKTQLSAAKKLYDFKGADLKPFFDAVRSGAVSLSQQNKIPFTDSEFLELENAMSLIRGDEVYEALRVVFAMTKSFGSGSKKIMSLLRKQQFALASLSGERQRLIGYLAEESEEYCRVLKKVSVAKQKTLIRRFEDSVNKLSVVFPQNVNWSKRLALSAALYVAPVGSSLAATRLWFRRIDELKYSFGSMHMDDLTATFFAVLTVCYFFRGQNPFLVRIGYFISLLVPVYFTLSEFYPSILPFLPGDVKSPGDPTDIVMYWAGFLGGILNYQLTTNERLKRRLQDVLGSLKLRTTEFEFAPLRVR